MNNIIMRVVFLILCLALFLTVYLLRRKQREIDGRNRRIGLLEKDLAGLDREKKRAEKEGGYLKELLNTQPDMVLGFSADGSVVFVNQAADVFLRIPEPLGRKYWEAVRDEQIRQMIADGLAHRRSKEERVEILPEKRFFRLTVYPTQDGLFLTGHDLTEEHRLALQRQEFTANASHELRSPLATVGMALETMRGFLKKEGLPFHRIAETQLARLASLARDLLTITEIETETALYNLAELDPASFLEEFTAQFRQKTQEAGIELTLSAPDGLPKIRADRHRLEQVLDNLLSNSLKYTAQNGQIKVAAALSESQVIISISDTGIGIPTEDLPRIFERFYRVNKDRNRQMGGTGLGLSIARHIVEAHGGRIWAESKLGEGSVFYFSIPTVPSPQPSPPRGEDSR